jgi:two-component system, OmpR family, sensor histidine kinase MtrB
MSAAALTRAVRRGLTFWRRSITARVVVSTMLLSSLVFAGVGWLLLQQIRDGLVDQRVKDVLAEAETETIQARDRLALVPGTDGEAATQRRELVEPIQDRGELSGFRVVLVGPVDAATSLTESQPVSSPGLDLVSVPPSLHQHFQASRTTAWTFTKIVADDPGGPRPGIAVGSSVRLPADGETHILYYLFSLDAEQRTMDLIARAMLTTALLLIVLVAVLTWLVTRQVVTPVRLAREVAERLAAGKLQERLRVRGEDDLSRLATSFNQMASNLQRQIRQLEELSRVQRRFVSDVSHELRTPLTTVRMAGEILYDARSSFDPVTARAAELLQTELDRFETLLTDLLEISRFDAGAAQLEVTDVNLVEVVRRVVDSTEALAARRGTQVVVESTGACLAEADVRRVERILRNLLTNAIDHAESGDVTVRVVADEYATAVAVRDYGVGLAPGQTAMVFSRFWRADPARARASGGTGLGLSIALEDTHLHGGWLQAWGSPGRGAQFRLTLPRRRGESLHHSPIPLVPSDAKELV